MKKQYDFRETEKKWYKTWLEKGYFRSEPDESKEPYVIVIPPPNVTDVLHLGHALNNTIQDIVIRWKRMEGYNAEWVPGTDHAGIATQVVVERKLAKEGKTRHDLGREKFVEEVWKWKEEHGSRIIEQLKGIGSSCDWSRTRFTLDESLSRAVREVFVRLYKKGLIYRGKYIINWCPRCHTALSNEEVDYKEENGKLYYIKYPLEDNSGYLTVATTRPETMLGDTAVAVNPEDKRYKNFIGKNVILPLVNIPIPVIADEYVDKEFGTGVVKITPAHDPNDFIVGKRHNLPQRIIMDTHAIINENGKQYQGLTREEARKKIIEDLDKEGLLEKIEDHNHNVGHCYRCKTVIEPYLSTQWFVKMEPLAKPAKKVVEDGTVKIFPQRWEKVYLHWLNNIQDWCISRQLWWGHRIPVWYCNDCGHENVSTEDVKKCEKCGSTNLQQDEDVLDTWFSSWLWPFSVFGWPEETEDYKYFYPTNYLTTASEILFFWVARMIMAGLEFTGKPPFTEIFIHGTVRDEQGRKMSKSLGNGIDPMEIVEKYGADSLRYSLIAASGIGQDPNIGHKNFESGRNFANKIWNATRFLITNAGDKLKYTDSPHVENDIDAWILSKLHKFIESTTDKLAKYRYSEVAKDLREFIWNEYCDWYLEFIKPSIYENKESSTLDTASYTLRIAMTLLHPIMPFITEEIYQILPHKTESIVIEKWPVKDAKYINNDVEEKIETLKNLITSIRNLRSSMGVQNNAKVNVHIFDETGYMENFTDYIKNLAKVEDIIFLKEDKKPDNSIGDVIKGAKIYMLLEGVVDVEKEKKKLEKEYNSLKKQIEKIENMLSNESFLKKAPENVINQKKNSMEEMKKKLDNIRSILDSLN